MHSVHFIKPVSQVLKYAVLLVLALSFIGPIWLMFVSAFRQTTSILSYPPKLWPDDGNFKNFVDIFTMQEHVFIRWFLNSVVVSAVNTLMVIAVSSSAAYAFAKRKFPGRNFLFVVVIATQMIPSVATLIPQYLIIGKLGWVNSYQGLIFPGVASAFGVFLMTQFMREIPTSMIEAASIDGCSAWGTFLRIVAPVVVPSISLLAIFNFTAQWGNLTWPLIIITHNDMRTLPLGIASMKDLASSVSGNIMAASLTSFLPVLVAFLFARDQFIAGMTVGAVKG